MFRISTINRAQKDKNLNAARNRHTGARSSKQRGVRMPDEIWDQVKTAAEQLAALFPGRYVTTNSALEFLVREGLRSLYSGTDD